MSIPLPATEFNPGFRLSVTDVAIVVGGACAAIEAPIIGPWIAIAIGHFFLFCNVLRLARPLELVWAATFVAVAVVTGADASNPVGLATLGAVTLAVAAIAVTRRAYHGILWKRLNPDLRTWWDAHRRVDGPRG